MSQQIIFYILAVITAVFSILSVTSKNIIRSATYLLLVLLSTAGMYLLLDYQYLFAVQTAVYAGGIMVMFIFAILLTHRPGEAMSVEKKRNRVLSALLSVVGIAFSAHIIYHNISKVYTLVAQDEISMKYVGTMMMGTDKYQYLLPFETVSILLLACIVGSIMIARKR